MVAPTKLFIQEIVLICALGFSLTCYGITKPEDLPQPPPLPPSLKNKILTPPPNLPDPTELYAQLEQLDDLLNMPADKLNRLRQTIEFIEKMSPDEREAMRIRLSQITQSTPEMKEEIQDLANRFPGVNKLDLSQFWLAASADERESVRNNLSKLDQEGQSTLLKAKVDAFVKRRDAVFESMRSSLEHKRQIIPEQPPQEP